MRVINMIAPWVQFPELPHDSLGWRMGGGEGYLDMFLEWLYQQDEKSLASFFEQYPVPDEWNSLFEYHLQRMKTRNSPWVA